MHTNYLTNFSITITENYQYNNITVDYFMNTYKGIESKIKKQIIL